MVLATAAAGLKPGTYVQQGLLSELGCLMEPQEDNTSLLDRSAKASLHALLSLNTSLYNGTLSIANAIVLTGPPPASFLSSRFENTCKEVFNSTVASVPTDPLNPNSCKHLMDMINKWCWTHSNGLISSIMDTPPPPQPNPSIILLNALHLKAKWETPFKQSLTSQSSFYSQGYAFPSSPCHMMTRIGMFSYAENDTFQAVRIPYAHHVVDATSFQPAGKPHPFTLAAYIILPKPYMGISEWLEGFGAKPHENMTLIQSILIHLSSQRDRVNISLFLPKFDVSTDATHADLTPFLREFPTLLPLFTPDGISAPFSPMLKEEVIHSVNERELHVSSIHQKVVVKVDEEGTEAAAVTAAMMSFGAASSTSTPSVQMMVDRGFFFCIGMESGGEGGGMSSGVEMMFSAIVRDVTRVLPP
ncbi:Serpin domain-containing protein [Chytridium lagenaria]|nr:Serpin domain-containing protein [Chytridium lagenaria]